MNYWYIGQNLPETFEIHEIEEELVLKEIKNLKIGKPSGLYTLSTRVIGDTFSVLITQVTHLMNLSIRQKVFPEKWKIAKVTPIPKDGNPTMITNYRPISILPTPSKILEHIIQLQLLEYLDLNNILDVNQGGFRKNYSTTAITTNLLDDIYFNMNEQRTTNAVFIDFCKAFDSINHELVLLKLKKELPRIGSNGFGVTLQIGNR